MVPMMSLVVILSIALGAASMTTAPSAIASDAVGGSKAQQSLPTAGGAGNVPGELLVRFQPNVPASEQAKIHGQVGASVIRSLMLPRVKLVRLHGMQSLSSAIRKYESHPQVEYAEPNSTAELASVVPNDTYFPRLWGLDNTGQTVNGVAGTPAADIGAQEAWGTTTGDASVTVGVADSGVDYNNPDLSPSVVPGYDFVDNDTDPLDDVWHGTFVAGIIGAVGNNGYGVTGVAWHVGLAPLRVCSLVAMGGVPPAKCTAADQADAYTYAGKYGMAVVNASLNSGKSSMTAYNAIKGASNTLFVAAAGNRKTNLDDKPQYPCNYDIPNVVCVGATDQHDALGPYSNYGASSVDLAAPGTNIWGIHPFVTSYSEAFSTDLSGRWMTGGINNTWARVCPSRKSCFLQDSPGSNYLNDTDSWAQTTVAASTVGGNHCQVQYDLKGVVASGDELRASVSSTGSTWTQVGTWSGSLTSWKTAQYPLSGFDGDESVYIRFELVSNSSGTADGVSIDNVKLNCLRDSGTYQDNEYAFSDGTSFATAYVSGAAALLKAQNPAATVREIKKAILDGVDSRSSLAGKTVTGGRLNVQRSLTLLPDATAPVAP
jgi:subtilisin family serine protease